MQSQKNIKVIEIKLNEYGKKHDAKALAEYVEGVDIDILCSLISRKVCHEDAPQLLDYILQGLSHKSASQLKRLKLTEKLLAELHSRELPARQVNNLMSRLAMHLERFSTVHLVKLTNHCIRSIISTKSEDNSWKDLLPKLLTVLATKDVIDHEGSELNGQDFKSQVIKTLCMAKWRPNMVTMIATMFIDMPLSSDELGQVINKLCHCLRSLSPQEVPPLTHQLLLLCRQEHSVVLFASLQAYFSKKLYAPEQRNEEEDMFVASQEDHIGTDDHETRMAEGTVLFYISQSASSGQSSIKNLLKFLKNSANAPELVLDPFTVNVLLTVSCVATYKASVLDLLKTAVTQAVLEEDKRELSAWVRKFIPTSCNVENLLITVTDNTPRERDYVIKGLAGLATELLNVPSARGREATTVEKLWSVGRHVLVRLVKKHQDTAGSILQLLCDRIIASQAVSQYIGCLRELAITIPLCLNEHRGVLARLLDQLPQLTGPVAREVVRAVLPLTRAFHSLRDSLVMVLRKALFSRNIPTRQMAVFGFLQLLRFQDVKALSSLTLSSQSCDNRAGPPLTQIDMEIHASQSNSKEAVCLELLGVLRRCLIQQAEVRIHLYKGLYVVVWKTRELAPYALDILLNHFNRYYVFGDDKLPPIDFSKVVNIQDIDAVVQEPVAHLVFVLQQVLSLSRGEETCTNSVTKLERILESLSNRMAKCTLENFGLGDANILVDVLPESAEKREILKQVLGLYEAVMSYEVSLFAIGNQNKANRINSLFKAYNRTVEFAKTSPKTAKKKEDKQKKAEKGNKSWAAKQAVFKFPTTVMDFETCIKFLAKIFSDGPVTLSQDTTNPLRGNRPLQRYIMRTTLELIQQTHTMQPSDVRNFLTVDVCNEIGSLLFDNCVNRFPELCANDQETASLAVECFGELLGAVMTYHKPSMASILSEICNVSAGDGIEEQLGTLVIKYQELLGDRLALEEEEGEDDPAGRKVAQVLVTTLTLLIRNLPSSGARLQEVLEWLTKLAEEQTVTRPGTFKGLLSLLIELNIRCKAAGTLLDNLALQLCTLMGVIHDESVEKHVTYALLSGGIHQDALTQVATAIKGIVDEVDWSITRLRAEYASVSVPGKESAEIRWERLQKMEADVCCHLSHCVRLSHSLSKLQVPTGPASDAILQLLISIYTRLCTLTKYFVTRSSKTNLAFQEAKFENVIRLAGKHLAPSIYELISHIEAYKKEDGKAKKKQADPTVLKSKVLRETRLIPKVVFEMEQFEKFIIQLSNKSKVDLTALLKHSVSRDFRIHVADVKNMVNPSETVHEATINEGDKSQAAKRTSQNTQGGTKRLDTSAREVNKSSRDPHNTSGGEVCNTSRSIEQAHEKSVREDDVASAKDISSRGKLSVSMRGNAHSKAKLSTSTTKAVTSSTREDPEETGELEDCEVDELPPAQKKSKLGKKSSQKPFKKPRKV